MANQEIAQEINNRIGNSPVPFDSVYSIALEIYQELGGEESQFDSVYSILLETLNVIDSGISAKVIDDSSISLTKTWSSSKIASELANAGFQVEIVTELPSVGDPHTIYFILKSDSSVGDVYDEWMYIDGNWEKVGNTAIDLSDYATLNDISTFITLDDTSIYATKTYVDASLNLKADKSYVDASLALKADVYEVATIAEIEALFAAPEPEPTYPPLNQIWYTTSDGQEYGFEDHTSIWDVRTWDSINAISNVYSNGKGIVTYPVDMYTINGFGNINEWDEDNSTVTTVWLPYLTKTTVVDGDGGSQVVYPFENILNYAINLTDVYYPGTCVEFAEAMYNREEHRWVDCFAGDSGSLDVAIHCSDGDFTWQVPS